MDTAAKIIVVACATSFIVCILLQLQGCSGVAVYAGVGAHSNDYDHEKWEHPNPLGILGVEYEQNITGQWYFRGNLEHYSEFFENDERGFNTISGRGVYKFK